MNSRRASIIVAFSIALLPCASLASTRTVGQTLVYDLTEVNHASVPPGLPAAALARFQAVNGKPLTSTLTVSIDKVDPDGSAHVNASMVNAAMASLPSNLRDPASDFQGTLMPDGRIVPTYDPSLHPTAGAGGVLNITPAISQNNVAGMTIGRLDDFNAFAQGCGARASIKNGDSWRQQYRLSYSAMEFSFTAGATEMIAGHAAVAVTMKTSYQSPQSSESIVASGHYDLTQRLVVDFHDEVQSTTPAGPASRTADFTLRP